MAFKNTIPGKTKADLAFCSKATEAVEKRDWSRVATLFNQYGSYLELVDMTLPLAPSEVADKSEDMVDLVKNYAFVTNG